MAGVCVLELLAAELVKLGMLTAKRRRRPCVLHDPVPPTALRNHTGMRMKPSFGFQRCFRLEQPA
jgi:hypothetical protein